MSLKTQAVQPQMVPTSRSRSPAPRERKPKIQENPRIPLHKVTKASRDVPGDPSMKSGEIKTDLPTGFAGKPGDGHPVDCTSRSRGSALVVCKAAAFAPVSGSSGKLDGQAFSHEIGSVCMLNDVSKKLSQSFGGAQSTADAGECCHWKLK